MTRPNRSYGRPGTAVIPADWAASHRPVAAGTMTATVELRHPGTTQGWSDEAEQNVATPGAPYYTGPARIQGLATRDQVALTAEDREVVIRYLVTVDADVAPLVDDTVTVTVVDDTRLVGRSLQVGNVVTGSLRFERDLFCTLTG